MLPYRSTAVVIALAVALAGCGSSGSATHAGAARARSQALDGSLPQPSQRCGTPDVRATVLRFPARDGVGLDGAIVGGGSVGAVLVHEYPGPMCGWWPYANYLAAHGVRALLFDLRCFGLSACPASGKADPVADVAGAIAALRSHGARSVAVVGASLGGVVAVIAGARLHPAAIVDLSGERDLTGLLPGTALDAYAAAPALRAPALFAVARGDRDVSVGDMRAVYDRAGSRVRRMVVLPASQGHGWDMLESFTGFAPLARTVVTFVKAHTGR
jgi:pimeloyl-ACP methyl ester carboxylesterase